MFGIAGQLSQDKGALGLQHLPYLRFVSVDSHPVN